MLIFYMEISKFFPRRCCNVKNDVIPTFISTPKCRWSPNHLPSCQETKIRHDAMRVNKFKKHLWGDNFVYFNVFFQSLFCTILTAKQNFLAEHIKILTGSLEMRKIGLNFFNFFSWAHHYLESVNYIKKSQSEVN